MLIDERRSPPGRLHVDLYSEGSAIYRVNAKGEVEEIAAWARNKLIAERALEALRAAYPEERFEQRKGGWVQSG